MTSCVSRRRAVEAEICTVRAAQGVTSQGDAAGTSYAAQANVARAGMNTAPAAHEAAGDREHVAATAATHVDTNPRASSDNAPAV